MRFQLPFEMFVTRNDVQLCMCFYCRPDMNIIITVNFPLWDDASVCIIRTNMVQLRWSVADGQNIQRGLLETVPFFRFSAVQSDLFAPEIHHYFMIDLWRVTSCVLLLLFCVLSARRYDRFSAQCTVWWFFHRGYAKHCCWGRGSCLPSVTVCPGQIEGTDARVHVLIKRVRL